MTWRIPLGDQDDEAQAIRSQRATAFKLAERIESGEVLKGINAKWAATIISGMAPHFPRPASRPPKDWPERSLVFSEACTGAATALHAGLSIRAEDVPSAVLALRSWARGLKSKRRKGRPSKVPGDAAVIATLARQQGVSKRRVIAEIAEDCGVDDSNAERAVDHGRDDAQAFLRWAGEVGGTIHPKRRD